MELICPYCGNRIDDYFSNLEEEDWTILKKRTCDDETEAECKGCVEISEVESFLNCPNCEEEVWFYCKLKTHCKDGETILALRPLVTIVAYNR